MNFFVVEELGNCSYHITLTKGIWLFAGLAFLLTLLTLACGISGTRGKVTRTISMNLDPQSLIAHRILEHKVFPFSFLLS